MGQVQLYTISQSRKSIYYIPVSAGSTRKDAVANGEAPVAILDTIDNGHTLNCLA